jgi:thiamine transport system substrate-binding protein
MLHHNLGKRVQSAALSLLAIGLISLSFVSCATKGPETLTIYAYDSFVSEWGPGPKVIPLFEKATGLKVNLVSKGDAGQVLSSVIEEKKAPRADVVIGLDQNLLAQAVAADVLLPYKAKGLETIPADLRFDPQNRLTPYDYGQFAFIWDTQKLKNPPASLDDLLKPEYKGKVILMDPRTSSTGLGFLAWMVAQYGDGWKDYWTKLQPSILTIGAGWDASYGLFLQGEAPLVISYTTSPAYHVYSDKTDRYKALIFAAGHTRQIEAAGIVKGTRNKKAAEKFIDFMLTAAFQNEIPLTNWMYPAVEGLTLPECYQAAPKAPVLPEPQPEALKSALASWADLASK